MVEARLNFVNCPDAQNGHSMAYWEWGSEDCGHVVICAHGLTRQGRDFDVLARALCATAPGQVRVVCPDVVGRGRSDWLTDPMGYQIPTYAADMLALLAQLKPKMLDWVGTSMGGLIGMVMCGQADLPLPVPVRKLVLNDVGPVIEWQAIERIAQYLGRTGRFDTEQQAADAMWMVSRSFGPHTPEQWLALSKPMLKPWIDPATGLPDGFTLNYDPGLAVPVAATTQTSAKQAEAMLWALYDNITAQTLITRGAESDLLSLTTAQAMTQRGPKATLIEFAGVGHAPTFIADNQTQAVIDFLLP